MRLLIGFALVLVGIAFVQGQLVIPQINNANAIISLLPQLQGFLGQLDTILPQLTGILSSSELQSLKDKITQVVLSQLGGNLDLNSITDKLRPIIQQFLGSKPLGRIDIDTLLQQVAGAAASALPGLILGFLGKREAIDTRAGINDILALVDKFQLNTILPQIEQFLGPDKLQQLQNQLFATVIAGLGNNWNAATLAQAVQQLITQFVPQAAQMRIDWGGLANTLLQGAATVAPSLVLGALFGKREAIDTRAGINDILALVDKFQLNTILPQIEQFLGPDKLQQLQNQLFATVIAGLGNNWNAATLAQAVQQLITQFVPQAAQMRIDWGGLANTLLQGAATVAPSLVLGALFGKREAIDTRAGINDILALVDKFQLNTILPQIEQFLGPDKLQQLQNQLFATVIAGLGNNWNAATLAQAVQQLITQFVPQVAQMRIDWAGVGNTLLQGTINALPSVLMGALFGKRSLNVNYQQLLAQLPVDKLAQIIQVVSSADKTVAFAKLRKLLESFFPGQRGRFNFDEIAANLLNNLNNLLPLLSQTISSAILG